MGGFVCHTCTVRICETRLSTSRGTCLYSALSAFMQRPAKCPMDFCCCQVPMEFCCCLTVLPHSPPHLGLGFCQAGSHLLGHTHRRSCSGLWWPRPAPPDALQLRRHLLLPSSTASTEQRAQRTMAAAAAASAPLLRLSGARGCCLLLPPAPCADPLADYVCCMRCRFSHLQQISRTVLSRELLVGQHAATQHGISRAQGVLVDHGQVESWLACKRCRLAALT